MVTNEFVEQSEVTELVVHGSTAATPRPAGAVMVHWVGDVAPTNAATDDEWTDRVNKLVKRWNGTGWDTLGGAGGASTLAALTDVSETSPVDGDVLTYVASASKWENQATPPGILKFLYGDGSDGAVVFDGTSTVLGMVPSANVYTLNREVAATNLTINVGVTVVTGNYRLFANGTLTNNGTIQNDGGSGTNAIAGSLRAAQVLAATAGGGAGATGVGTNGSAQTTSSFGGNGGNGGAGVSAGGTGGAAGVSAGGLTAFHNLPSALNLGLLFQGLFAAMKGGGGGGGGGGDGTNSGGGGGAGGGIVAIYALHIVNSSGTFSAKGGNGATRTTGNVGGGGGGGGGAIVVVSGSAQSGTVTVAGGAPGSGVGTGVAGVAGSAGNILWLVA